MSLARLAIRLCLVRMLTGATNAGDAVFDSRLEPIDEIPEGLKPDDAIPVIVITTDEHTHAPDGGDFMRGNTTLDVVIETRVVKAMDLAPAETDGNLEIMLDLLDRQVLRALQEASGPWHDLFRRFATVSGTLRAVSRRGGDVSHGIRFCARQKIISLDTINDAPFGPVEEGTPWATLLELLDGDPQLGWLRPLLLIEMMSSNVAEWQRARAQIAETDNGAVILGLGLMTPAVGGVDVDGAEITQIATDTGLVVNEEIANDQLGPIP